MPQLIFITHPEVVIDPAVPVPNWPLSDLGRSRMQGFAGSPTLARISAIWASAERKALDGAEILAARRGLTVSIDAALGENDRSATGYVAPPEFWEIVREFFDKPRASVRGWERAVDAQRRIVDAVERVAAQEHAGGDVAIVSHGGVGCLLMAHLRNVPISRELGPPHPGGGCFFAIDRATRTLRSEWRLVEHA